MKQLIVGMVMSLLLSVSNGSDAYTIVSQDLDPYSYTASSSWQGLTPDLAFDGNWNNNWNSGAFAGWAYNSFPWIEVDLGQERNLLRIVLGVEQHPAYAIATKHILRLSFSYMGNDLSAADCNGILNGTYQGNDIFTTIQGQTFDGQHLLVDFETPVNARYVQVRSLRSRSWIAWNEIQILTDDVELPASPAATPAPEPGTGILMAAGAVGFGVARFKKWKSRR